MKEPVHQPPKKSRKKLRLKVSKEVVFLCSCCAVVIIFSLSTFNTSLFLNGNQVLGASSQAAGQDKISFWQDLVTKYPTYMEGWVELAKLEIKSGNLQQATFYLEKAKEIDPNSNEVKQLETAIGLTP